MSLRGDLRQFPPPQLLNLVNLAAKTGTLTVKGKELARLSFHRGKLIYASIGDGSRDLPQILWLSGLLTTKQARIIQSHAPGMSEKQVGRLLIHAGLLTQSEIVRSVRQHALDIAGELLTWSAGEFSFVGNELPPADSIIISANLESVIMEAQQRLQEWLRLKTELPDLDIYLRYAERPNLRPQNIQLTIREWRVVASSNARRTVRQIARANQLTAFQIRRIVYGLLQAGLVEVVRAPQTLPTAV